MGNIKITREEAMPGPVVSAKVSSNIDMMPITVSSKEGWEAALRVQTSSGDQLFYKPELREWAKAVLEMCGDE